MESKKAPTEGLKYTLSGDFKSYSVTGIGKAKGADIVIADTYEGKPVTSIGNSAFFWYISPTSIGLTSITIPDSVTSIGKDAFKYCSSLTAVYITDIVKWCEINFGYGEANPLYYAHNLYIDGELATNITIPESVTSIGGWAFCNCSSLTSITIPDSVTSIGNYAFEECRGLTAVYITDIGKWCEIDFGYGEANPLHYAHNLYINGELATNITIHEGVTRIRNYAFRDCSSLTNITIPDSVTSIGNYAFGYCENLTSITIPDSVTSIGESAFSGCKGLTSITFKGTKARWNRISKRYDWDNKTGNYTVHCTNGDIKK